MSEVNEVDGVVIFHKQRGFTMKSVTIQMKRKHIPIFLLACLVVLIKGTLPITLEDSGI